MMKYLIILLLALTLASCNRSEVKSLEAERLILIQQLTECEMLAKEAAAQATAAQAEAILAREEAELANERAQESAASALEVIERAKNKK